MLGLSSWIVIPLALTWGAVIILGLYAELSKRRRLRTLLSRGDMTRAWSDRFPNASLGEISAFLDLFTAAFDLPKHSGLKLSPDDRVADIQRVVRLVLQPTRARWLRNMGTYRFTMGLMDKYDTFVRPDQQLTLGQAFAKIAVAHAD